ncbi:glycoside hydrolase family 2 protein [uncultured Odoribacter sp.]|uniref:beta-glucuronidase LacZ4 n=1 Tax=uncultured Odoribacter sp. TaxID=876416 RepID=UPI0026368BBF|nr:glycoside hydrolase family 2 TIM barrel-domain containing protein [uncultured Odoribacter sp.]
MKYILIIFWCSVVCQVWGREVISLNRSWKFTPGYETKKNTFTEVNLPHTWNQDALTAKINYYRGLGNYEKDIDIPVNWQGKCIYLRFKGVNTIANVFINGRHAGEHRGGYTAFAVDLTPYIRWGEKNTIWVRVNNSPQLDIMPLVGDFNMYGGIYRDVELIVTDPYHISLSDYGSFGVYFTPAEVSRKKARIQAKILAKGKTGCSSVIRVKIEDREGKTFLSEEQKITFDEKGEAVGELTLEVKQPHLWNGRKDPFLYHTVTELIHEGQIKDRVNERIGIRNFRVDPNEGFFLNGEHLQLKGVCRHQDRPEIGNALLPLHHWEDMALIKEMGANAVRLAHYPQDRYVYDLCDEYGFIVWAEIPFVGPGGYRDKGFVNQASFRENGITQLKELIRQNYNHPSICFWGLFNELKQTGDDPVKYIEELHTLAHQEDPSRLTTAASNQNGILNEVTDLIAWNQYYGWYGGEPDGIGEWADAVHKKYPGKPVGISEYGAGGSILHQQEELKKPIANSYWHPENWQTFFHEEHWKAIDQRPYLWGTFVWNMFDFGAAHRQEGEIAGKNDKGLVTFDRKTKKDAFYFYKANWNLEEPFVYIAERRLKQRSGTPQQIKIYSNQPEVELLLNGKSLGVRKGTYGIFIWPEVFLKAGENILFVRSKQGVTDKVKILF